MKKTYFLKLTSAVAIAGKLHKPGSVVELDEHASKDLLRRGKARPAVSDDLPQLAGVPDSPDVLEFADDTSLSFAALIQMAHKASGLTVDVWNGLEVAERGKHLEAVYEPLVKAAHKRAKAKAKAAQDDADRKAADEKTAADAAAAAAKTEETKTPPVKDQTAPAIPEDPLANAKEQTGRAPRGGKRGE